MQDKFFLYNRLQASLGWGARREWRSGLKVPDRRFLKGKGAKQTTVTTCPLKQITNSSRVKGPKSIFSEDLATYLRKYYSVNCHLGFALPFLSYTNPKINPVPCVSIDLDFSHCVTFIDCIISFYSCEANFLLF